MGKENKELHERILKSWKKFKHPTIKGIAEKLHCSRITVRRVLRKNEINWGENNRYNVRYREIQNLRRECSKILHEIYSPALIKGARRHIKLPTKIIYCDDQHIPFVNLNCIQRMLEYDGDAEYFVWSEVLNLDAFAVYVKQYISQPLKEDEIAGRLTDLFLSKFKAGFTLQSNHMLRIDKFLSRITDPVQLDYLRKSFSGLLPSILKLRKNLEYVGLPILQIGQAVFAHYDSFLSTPGATVRRIQEGLMNWADALGIEKWDSLWIGHTHNQMLHFYQQRLLAEIGCMCYIQDYVLQNKIRLSHAKFRWVNGYAVIYLQKDGSTDFQASHLQFLQFAKLPNWGQNEINNG